MNRATLVLLGAPFLEVGGQPAVMDTRKALALLAYLTLGEHAPGQGHTRDALAALFYPDSDQASARAALRRTLSPLRKVLDEKCLETGREQIRVNLDCLWVDALAFRQALAETRQHGHAAEEVCVDCLPLLERAASLFRDSFMSGFSLRDSPGFDDWQFFQGEALRQELCDGLERLSRGLAAQGNLKEAASQARRWLALDKLNEAAQRQLMLIYAWDNQRNAALRQYRECVRTLDQELSVPPLEETTLLQQAILENRIPVVPALAPSQAGEKRPSLIQASAQPPAGTPGKSSYPFAGREKDLKALLEAYQSTARQGQGGFLFVVEGEAGIGKTRLAEEFLAEISRQPGFEEASLIQARCYESEMGLAYAPFLNGLGEAANRPGAMERLKGLSPGQLSLAGQLMPGLTDLFPGLPPPPAADAPGAQVRFLDALRAVIQALAAPRSGQALPGILFIDDLQWADQASLGVLEYCARRLEGLFLLATWRSDLAAAEHPLRALAAQARREQRGASLSLARLQMEDVAAMASNQPSALTQEQIRRLHQESEGNPFFVTAYLENQRSPEEPAGQEMPQSVRGLLLARISRASELGRQVLSAAAVVGRSVDFGILREVSGRSEIETVTALEELLQHNLVREHNGAEGSAALQYDFTHDKLRETAYAQTSLARRRLLHGRAAESHASRARHHREAAALAAFHYHLAGQLEQAAQWFAQAGENDRAVYANQDAIAHFQSALACGHPQPAAIHESIADTCLLSGQYAEAQRHYEAAAAACAPERLPWIEHKLGSLHNQLGNFELAECHLQTALDELSSVSNLPADAPAERALIFADWSHTVYRRGDAERALKLALQAVHLAQSCQDGRALAQAANNLGILQRVHGEHRQAIQTLENSLRAAEKLGDPEIRAAALNNLARVYAETDQIERAIQYTRQALEICEQRGDRHRSAALLNNLADLFHAAGLEEESMAHLRKAVVIFAEIGGEPARPAGLPETDNQAGLFPEIWKLTEW